MLAKYDFWYDFIDIEYFVRKIILVVSSYCNNLVFRINIKWLINYSKQPR